MQTPMDAKTAQVPSDSFGTRAVAFLPFVFGCVAIFLVSGMSRPPIPKVLIFPNSDKVLHAIAYGGLAALAWIGTAFSVRWRRQTRAALLSAASLAWVYGWLDEFHQSFVPGRSSSIWDVAADGTGALLGVFLASAVLSLLCRRFFVPRMAVESDL